MSDKQTRERILDVAEKLFSDNGFDGTSLRMITADAGVNLAAVHYHFGSKVGLLQATARRCIDPVNDERIRRLDRAIEDAGGEAPSVEAILDAFVRPTVAALHGLEAHRFMGIFQIMHSREIDASFFRDTFGDVLARFSILSDALPHLTEDEIAWRFHFLVGSLMQSFNRRVTEVHPHLGTWDPSELADALVAYAAAGFRAPATRTLETSGPAAGQETP